MISNIAKRLVYRKAILDDDAVAIADLVYQSNPTLYSYWFKNKDGIMEYFENRFNDPSFPFGFTNCFIAYEDTDEHDTLSDSVLGVIIGWHSGMDASYDFYDDTQANQNSYRTIEAYIKPALYDARKDSNVLTIFGISVLPDYRRQAIGSKLLETYLRHMKKQYRINEVRLAHLEEDINAHRFFVHNKFNCYGSSIGFDGTPNPNIKTILCRRQI